MSETIMMTAIICVTIAFCVFVLCAVWSSKIKNKTILDGDHDFIDREEFEEYEHMINGKLSEIENELREKR